MLAESIRQVGHAALADPALFFSRSLHGPPLEESTCLSVLDCMEDKALADAAGLFFSSAECLRTFPIAATEKLINSVPEDNGPLLCKLAHNAVQSHCPALVEMLVRKLPQSVWAHEGEDGSNAVFLCLSNAEEDTKEADMDIFALIVDLCPHRHLVTLPTVTLSVCDDTIDSAEEAPKGPLTIAAEKRMGRTVDILLERISAADALGSRNERENPCTAAASAGDVEILALLLAWFKEHAEEEGMMDRLNMLAGTWAAAAIHQRLDVLAYLLDNECENEDDEPIAGLMQFLLHRSVLDAQWLLDSFVGMAGVYGRSHNLLTSLAFDMSSEIFDMVVEECLRLPRDELTALLLWNSDKSVPGLSYPKDCVTYCTGDDDACSFYRESMPPLLYAAKDALLTQLMPLVEAVPECLYSTKDGKTVFHVIASATIVFTDHMSILAGLAPREVVLARCREGKTALDYLDERGSSVPPELACCMAAATKSAAM
mmetsp:Transcript_8500/g.35479  ORF Transcript_8500/g.35479 Transcript_8500/m.35479 type:complete len:485 (+) Transcript_8500:78-1532(+)